ncbi:uncharacterized protein LOC121381457 [Gigantopelta aegis]|uniref:uncharacterized protein LOC121381457 n=1 Tax=Gigantopelta aegis TaxID=1735272 RepID=UPI001B889703|nr:uncharacterized protein LOC121381457 [Gigantopelta aegis]
MAPGIVADVVAHMAPGMLADVVVDMAPGILADVIVDMASGILADVVVDMAPGMLADVVVDMASDCPSPPVVHNSKQLFDASAVPRSQGTSLPYECQSGFVAENDLTTIICQENGTWTHIVCKRPDCPSPPPVFADSDQQFNPSTVSTAYGETLQYACKAGFVSENNVTTSTCGVDATWTSIACKQIRSCSEVKACNSQYGDGEYWISPPLYRHAKVKIYCHGINSSTPTEYVTLNVVNTAYYPTNANPDCKTKISSYHKTDYSKIRVYIQSMEVNRTDRTFAKTVSDTPQDYGEAADCCIMHCTGRAKCGPEGTFSIDTTGTGLIVDRNLDFELFGACPWGEWIRNTDGTRIDLRCGGLHAGCRPKTRMKLYLGPTAPPSNSAINPTCS